MRLGVRRLERFPQLARLPEADRSPAEAPGTDEILAWIVGDVPAPRTVGVEIALYLLEAAAVRLEAVRPLVDDHAVEGRPQAERLQFRQLLIGPSVGDEPATAVLLVARIHDMVCPGQ